MSYLGHVGLVHANSVGWKHKMHVLLKNSIVEREKQGTGAGNIANNLDLLYIRNINLIWLQCIIYSSSSATNCPS